MSPLWSEESLAHAAWAKAVARGLVDDKDFERKKEADLARVRRILRPRRHSYAL